MDSKSGITNFSAYVPNQAMSRTAMVDAIGWTKPSLKAFNTGSRRYVEWDEDPITLSVAAASSLELNTIKQLCFASTSAPFLDRQNAGIIATALDLPTTTHCFELSGSQRAGSSALINMSKITDNSILVAADCRKSKAGSPAEMLNGDASAALSLGTENVLAEIIDTETIYADIVDHYRTEKSGTDYYLEDRWFRDEGLNKIVPQAVSKLLVRQNISVTDISHFILPVPNPSMAKSVAKTLGIANEAVSDSLYENCGYTGCAHSLLMLINVLDKAKADEWILLCGFGQGCDTVLLKATSKLVEKQRSSISLKNQLKKGKVETNYTKFLSSSGLIDIDWGMRSERDNRTAHSVAFNKTRDIYGFVGGKCTTCKTPQFPKSRRCVNPECSALDTQIDYRFSSIDGKIKSFTEDWLAFTRNPPLMYGNVDFEGGGNIFLEITGFGVGEISIGTKVSTTFRIKDIDSKRGFHRYFWKAAPEKSGHHV